MERLASPLPARFPAHFRRSLNVLFDEMMGLCKGQSADTMKMPGKPIDQGYKIFALSNQSYKYLFVFCSGTPRNVVINFTQTTN